MKNKNDAISIPLTGNGFLVAMHAMIGGRNFRGPEEKLVN